jgi:hypothetical protein
MIDLHVVYFYVDRLYFYLCQNPAQIPLMIDLHVVYFYLCQTLLRKYNLSQIFVMIIRKLRCRRHLLWLLLKAQLNIRMQPRPGSQKGARSAPFASCAEGTTGVGLVPKKMQMLTGKWRKKCCPSVLKASALEVELL